MSSTPEPWREHQTAIPLVRIESEPQPGSSRQQPSGLLNSQVGHESQRESAPPLHSGSSEGGGLFPRAPLSPRRLRRSSSPKSLPEHVQGEEFDLTNSSQSRHSYKYGSSLPAISSIQNAPNAIHHIAPSDPSLIRHNNVDSPRTSPGHAPTPLRLFWPLNRTHSREERFVTVDPYRFRIHLFTTEIGEEFQHKRAAFAHLPLFLEHAILQSYRHILLRLPSMYFTRVSRIFEEADVTRPEIQRMIDGVAQGLDLTHDWSPPNVSPALARFKDRWEDFIEIIIQEWKTLNVVSALLLSALLTMFQIDDANNQPIVRAASLIALVCTTWSLIYGGVYIMRFRTMRSMYKASTFAQEAQKTKTKIFWNVWVLLALPAVWLAWSMIMFFVAILAFVWTSGSSDDNPEPPPPHIELIPRVIITALFAVGALYFVLILQAFKAYGASRTKPTDIRTQVNDARHVAPNMATNRTVNPVTGTNPNSLGLNLNSEASGMEDEHISEARGTSWQKVELEKGEEHEIQPEGRKGSRRGSPGLGELGL